jgi:hypothetical protein
MTNNINTDSIPTNDRACLMLMLELQRDAASYLADAARYDISDRMPIYLTQFDYFSDSDDYNPAAANLLRECTYALTSHEHETARDTLLALLATDDFLDDAETADFSTPLFDLILTDD